MIHDAIFSDKEGGGYIADSYTEVAKLCQLHAEPIMFGDTELLPICKTDLEGFYNRPVLYMGYKDAGGKGGIFLPDDALEMVFYIGDDEGKYFFKSVYWISRDRFYIQYNPKGGSDFNRVNGEWDFNRVAKRKGAVA